MRLVAFGLLSFAFMLAVFIQDACADGAAGGALGLRIGGGGETYTEVETGFGTARGEADYIDQSGMLVTAWFVPGLFGARAGYIGNVEVDDDDGDNFNVGHQIDLRARGDYGIPIPSAGKLKVHLLGEVGPLFILPDHDLEDLYQSLNLNPTIRPGLGVGAGAGVSFQLTDRISLRGDLLGEYLAVNLLNADGNTMVSRGSRFWILAGAQF